MIDRRKPLEVCKIEACNLIKYKVDNENISVNRALQIISDEADIPFGTLKRWFYPDSYDKYEKEKRGKIVSNPRQPSAPRDDLEDLYSDVENRIVKQANEIRKAKREEKKLIQRQKHAMLMARAEKYKPNGLIKLIHNDFRKVEFEDESIDLILTDPPYPKEFLPLWSDLAELAARVLKPGKFCVAYSGQLHLPEVITRISEHLDYYWTSALYHQGPTQLVHARNVICEWKPILIFYKPPFRKIERQWSDYVVSPAREKAHHDWQQSEAPYEYLIDFFSEPGDLVLDPFAGGGTVPVVCKRKKRRCVAVDIEEENVKISLGRLMEA